MDRWEKDSPEPEWHNDESLERGKKKKKTKKDRSEAPPHRWNSCFYWWDCQQQQQDEFWHILISQIQAATLKHSGVFYDVFSPRSKMFNGIS